MTSSFSPSQRWETRVIHLNIANDPPAAPAQGPQPAPSSAQNPLFSASYLKQEFPDHYAGAQQPAGEQSQHPAVQLQGFINGLGQEGWEFVGVFPIGQLVMMFFRRSFPQGPTPAAPQVPDPPAESPLPALEPLLQQILQRLEALEGAALLQQQGQSAQSPRPALRRSNPPSRQPAPPMGARRAEVRVLNQVQRQHLPPEPALPTLHAATALGLRSPGGLLTYGARHGFPPGLVKLVNNGMAAVYLGTEKRQGGGKSIRLWKVLPQSALPPE